MWQCKAGVQAAIQDIKSNHPNDMVSVISFSGPAGYNPLFPGVLQNGFYNMVRAPLGRDYNRMIDSLYFAPRTMNTGQELSPYDTDMTDVPRAVAGTNYAFGLMLAYNQFSRGSAENDLRAYTNSPFPRGTAGGLGRRGAQKMIIFETDGACSSTCYDTLSNMFSDQGPYKSYFKVRQKDSQPANSAALPGNEFPNFLTGSYNTAETQCKEVADLICASDTSPTLSGFSMKRKPVRIHCLAFGSLFDPATPTTDPAAAATLAAQRDRALQLLQYMQYKGGVQTAADIPLESYKRIIGNSTTRINNLRDAFSKVMQDGYSITLIE